MEDTRGSAQRYREVFNLPGGEPIITLRSPGFLSCPVADERGVTNCTLAFEHRGVPADPQAWMRR